MSPSSILVFLCCGVDDEWAFDLEDGNFMGVTKDEYCQRGLAGKIYMDATHMDLLAKKLNVIANLP